MATNLRMTTPPPPSSIRTPTTPKFGYDDNYEPYSPRRKSARVSSQRSQATRTPPNYSHSRLSPHSPRSANTVSIGISSPPPSSPPPTMKKRISKGSPTMRDRRVSGALDHKSTASAAAALGLPAPRNESKIDSNRSRTTLRDGMLPTPAKTPKKRPSETAPAIASVARNLFPSRADTINDLMPSPKKNRKSNSGTGYSFGSDEKPEPIAIHVDSTERIPEVDLSAENPFISNYGPPQPEPTKRSSKRRKVTVPGEGEQSFEEVERREDGLIVVFRGKKTFRKFTDEDGTGSRTQDDAELNATVPASLSRPLTRSSIKPRLLFPNARRMKAKEMRSQATEDEEEAVTDIEDPGVSTPTYHIDEIVSTPKAPRFAPASPPTTARTTRSKKLEMSSSPAGLPSDDEHVHSSSRNSSPFLGWRRVKSTSGGSKREGESLVGGKAKKTRG